MRTRAEAKRNKGGESGVASRRRPKRAGATDLSKFEDADGGVQKEESEKV